MLDGMRLRNVSPRVGRCPVQSVEKLASLERTTFKLRDLVEVTPPGQPSYYGLVSAEGMIVALPSLCRRVVKPEWCRLVPMTLIVKDGEWRLE